MSRPSHRYYQLVASLPFLPRPRQAERLPINEPRLEQRLNLLPPEDREIVMELQKFIRWQNHDLADDEAAVGANYQKLRERNHHPAVRAAIDFRMNLRTVMAALRRRHRGESDPPSNSNWGAGKWVRHIETNWNHPDFRLAPVFPWLPQVRDHLEKGETRQLEELAMNLAWEDLEKTALNKPFGLEAVIAFLFKWDILKRWLSYQEEAAREQFDQIAEAMFGRGTEETGQGGAA